MEGSRSFRNAVPAPPKSAAASALRRLMDGNSRYLSDSAITSARPNEQALRKTLSRGQKPYAALLTCSDSRVPVERIFDSGPGELFVVRVAGNIAGTAHSGVIGSTEYAVGHLKTDIVMVLGHTKCGAVSAAVRTNINGGADFSPNLSALVNQIDEPAKQALELPERQSTPEVIEQAIKFNVFHSMEQLMIQSKVLHSAVQSRQIEIHGAVYDLDSGKVTHLGRHPRERDFITQPIQKLIRTASEPALPADDALIRLRDGNQRFVRGEVEQHLFDRNLRGELVQQGQRPLATILGCADSRVPIEMIFDMKPGDLFVLRNAGSTCGSTFGGLIGSAEYSVGHLHTRLLVVLGHTKCGAVAAAMEAHLNKASANSGIPEGLNELLSRIRPAVEKAAETKREAPTAEKVACAIELNVWRTIEELIWNSTMLKGAAASGELQLHGAVYDLEEGEVSFMGQHPELARLLAMPCKPKQPKPLPPASAAVSMSSDGCKRPHGTPHEREVASQPSERKDFIEQIVANFRFQPSWYVKTKHGKQHIKEVIMNYDNWRAGITVALVSVPLSISLGVASGTTPTRGVATAIFGGLCASFFGSSDYNIIGPTGAVSGMFMSYCVKWSDDILPWLSLFSAVMVLVCALLKLHPYVLIMPTSVYEGFTVGVALIIGLNQINFACGLAPTEKQQPFVMNILESLKTLGETKAPSLILFLIQMPSLYFLMKKVPKVPWTVIITVLSIPIGVLCDADSLGFELLTLKSKYGMLKPDMVKPLRPLGEIAKSDEMMSIFVSAASTSLVAILETLISAKRAANRVDRSFDGLIEMRGLTMAHAVCGVTGAMPPAGVFMQTSLNTQLGPTHRFSQFLNAVIVAIIAAALMPVFSYLPQATIAAILVVSAIRMTPVSYLKKLWAESRASFVLCLVTGTICVGEDPVIGLAVGMVLALLMGAKQTLKADLLSVESQTCEGGQSYQVELCGNLTYINSEKFIEKARKFEDPKEISVDMFNLRTVDNDGATALKKIMDIWTSEESGATEEMVSIKGVGRSLLPALRTVKWFQQAEEKGRVSIV